MLPSFGRPPPTMMPRRRRRPGSCSCRKHLHMRRRCCFAAAGTDGGDMLSLVLPPSAQATQAVMEADARMRRCSKIHGIKTQVCTCRVVVGCSLYFDRVRRGLGRAHVSPGCTGRSHPLVRVVYRHVVVAWSSAGRRFCMRTKNS